MEIENTPAFVKRGRAVRALQRYLTISSLESGVEFPQDSQQVIGRAYSDSQSGEEVYEYFENKSSYK